MNSKDKGFQSIVMNGSWPKPDQLEMYMDYLTTQRASMVVGQDSASLVVTPQPTGEQTELFHTIVERK